MAVPLPIAGRSMRPARTWPSALCLRARSNESHPSVASGCAEPFTKQRQSASPELLGMQRVSHLRTSLKSVTPSRQLEPPRRLQSSARGTAELASIRPSLDTNLCPGFQRRTASMASPTDVGRLLIGRVANVFATLLPRDQQRPRRFHQPLDTCHRCTRSHPHRRDMTASMLAATLMTSTDHAHFRRGSVLRCATEQLGSSSAHRTKNPIRDD
jgi:hypothetical protein